MKDVVCSTKIVFISKDLLEKQHDFHTGGNCHEYIVCIHNLPIICQLFMLLDNLLAEHIFIKLCSRWYRGLDTVLERSGKVNEVRENISILIKITRESTEIIKGANSQLTIKEKFNYTYSNGTQRSKNILYPQSFK